MAMRWYVVHTYSNFERRVKSSLEERVRLSSLSHCFGEILVPIEEVVEMRDGVKRKSERKLYPGYVLVQMDMNDEAWHLVKNVPKVMGFIGGGERKGKDKFVPPTPISDKEAEAILQHIQDGSQKPRPKVLFEVGEVVRVIDGPFNDFNGVVEEANYEKNRLRVAVRIFGRSTPVELEFGQVEKE
ncbi:transcription termination/antitermination protein NusG [Candidatus Halobeggiatoa sp. HSG11]|nr:transcription termination/antitermination protein NusG [Candidatus Halobeggiatoa sp. HSG11]